MSLAFLERDLVNILASMTLKLPNYPDIFYKTGYRIEYFEKEFNILVQDVSREIKFDLIINNLSKNHSIPLECKSGQTEPDQLQRYSHVESDTLVRIGGISSQDPTMHTHDVAIVFNDENLDKIQDETVSYEFPLIAVSNSPTTITLLGSNFQDDDLMCFFNEPINYPSIVYEVFRLDGQTPLFKYAILIAEALVTLSVEGKAKFTIEDIIPSIFATAPDLYPHRIGNQLRITVEKKIDQVLAQGCKYELRGYYSWDKSFKSGALEKIHPGCKGSIYREFSNKTKEMAERLRLNNPVPNIYLSKNDRKSPGQFNLGLEAKE